MNTEPCAIRVDQQTQGDRDNARAAREARAVRNTTAARAKPSSYPATKLATLPKQDVASSEKENVDHTSLLGHCCWVVAQWGFPDEDESLVFDVSIPSFLRKQPFTSRQSDGINNNVTLVVRKGAESRIVVQEGPLLHRTIVVGSKLELLEESFDVSP